MAPGRNGLELMWITDDELRAAMRRPCPFATSRASTRLGAHRAIRAAASWHDDLPCPPDALVVGPADAYVELRCRHRWSRRATLAVVRARVRALALTPAARQH